MKLKTIKLIVISSFTIFLSFVGFTTTQQISRKGGVYSWNEPKGNKIDVCANCKCAICALAIHFNNIFM